ncbi:MAG: PD-(D/E)XK nuclease family protein [Verrucomicrobia bacterium]|nr:PD-(D/E)XK nuclease family protein [Verrucomicrobiota bacterium]
MRTGITRHFLPWDRPLLPQAAAWLAAAWSGGGPLDLGATLVIVPTRQSGRRLREGLAELAAGRGQGVFPPQVVLAEELLAWPAGGSPVASRLEEQLAWIEVLRTVRLDEFREVFPVDPVERDFSWAARLARQMLRLQRTLAENSLRMGDVATVAGGDWPEAGRWRQLAALERDYDRALASRGRRDPGAAGRATRVDELRRRGVTRVVLLATPDPPASALRLLEPLTHDVTVEVVVFAPADAAALFDGWGRPLAEAWAGRPLLTGDERQHVQLCADPVEQAERVVAGVRRGGIPEGALAIGVADAEVTPVMERRLREAGVAVFNPEGRARRRGGFYHLLAALGALVREPDFAAVAAVARCPDFLRWLARRQAGAGLAVAETLAQLDALHARHLPATLEAAGALAGGFPAARALLDAVADLRSGLTAGAFPAGPARALHGLLADRHEDDDTVRADATAWSELRAEAAAAAPAFPELEPAAWWEITLALFGEETRAGPKPAGAVELLGWLELLWEDAPHLVVAGLNDGRVPEAVAGDAFLPEALRERLGLRTNAARFARDAYLLAAVAAARATTGRLDLLLGKVSAAGDPVRPSRLLLQCDDAELPARVQWLFRDVEAVRPGPPWRRAWPLTPATDAPIPGMSVTAFRDYLRCPFRFYLRHGLKMETVDPEKTELDEADFGTLLHGALEEVARDPALRACADAAVLRDALLGAFERVARRRFGRELTLPLIVQFESARQRLARAAEVLAEQRALGWVVEQVEWKFPANFAVAGLAIRGRIDRIERHAGTGRVRVIDFKTADKPVHPRDAHCRRARREEAAPALARFEWQGESLVWTDLQLPLYLEAVAAEFGADATAGYFNLPKAVGETAVWEWVDEAGEWRAAARRCAEAVAAAVAARTFWPPVELAPEHEAERFAGLFHRGTAASVDWRGVP